MRTDPRHSLESNGETAYFLAAGRWETDDPYVYEYASRPWDVVTTPIARGPFGNLKNYLVTRSITIYHESFVSPIRLQGMSPAGMLGVGLPIRFGDRCRYWNYIPGGGTVPSTLPGTMDVVMDGGDQQLIALIARDFLRKTLPEDSVDALERGASMHQLPIPEHEANRLARWLFAMLEAAQHRTQPVSQDALARVIEEELPWRLTRACDFSGDVPLRWKPSARRRALDRAIEFLRGTDIASVTIGDLCHIASVSERTLEYIFRENLSLTPLRFIRLLRLYAARRELVETEPGTTTIGDIADRMGLLHHGRFAAEYNTLFGEMPSQTLARPPVAVECPLIAGELLHRSVTN